MEPNDNIRTNILFMERLKTPAEKAVEIEKIHEQRRLEAQQRELRGLQGEQSRLQEIEEYKTFIIRLINDCTDMPVYLPRSEDPIVCDLSKFLNSSDSELITSWLKENGYEMLNDFYYGYHITMKH